MRYNSACQYARHPCLLELRDGTLRLVGVPQELGPLMPSLQHPVVHRLQHCTGRALIVSCKDACHGSVPMFQVFKTQ